MFSSTAAKPYTGAVVLPDGLNDVRARKPKLSFTRYRQKYVLSECFNNWRKYFETTHKHTRARKKDTLKRVVKSSEAEDNGWMRVKEHKFSGKICIKFY